MIQTPTRKNTFFIGVALALTTVIIWSGNYVVAKLSLIPNQLL
jgi:hypothetical protein